MRAFLQRRFGSLAEDGVASIETVPIPTAKPGWVVVKVLAASSNPVDYKAARGDFGPAGRFMGIAVPRGVGLDVCGTIAEVGPKCSGRLRPGDVVWSMGAMSGGATGGSFAEYFALPEGCVYHAPTTVSAVDAASIPLAGITAIQSLRAAGGAAGRRVLVIGGSGGTGTLTIQVARAMGAAHITAVAGAGAALCRECGADAVIDYRAGDWADQHLAQEGAQRFNCVVDTVGGADEYNRAVRVMAPFGRFATIIGNVADKSMTVGTVATTLGWLAGQFAKRLAGAAPPYSLVSANAFAGADYRQLAMWVEEGKLRAVLDAEFPPCAFETDSVRALFARQMSHRAKGKLVCIIDPAATAVPIVADAACAAAAAATTLK